MANRRVSYSGRGIFSFLVKYNEYSSLILVKIKFFKPRNSQKMGFSCFNSSNSARSMLHQWRAAYSRSFTPQHDMRERGWSYPFCQRQSSYCFMPGELYKKKHLKFCYTEVLVSYYSMDKTGSKRSLREAKISWLLPPPILTPQNPTTHEILNSFWIKKKYIECNIRIF